MSRSRSSSSSESDLDMYDSDTDSTWDFSSDDESTDTDEEDNDPPNPSPTVTVNQNGNDVGPAREKGYNDADDGPPGMDIPAFTPHRPPGLQLEELLRTKEDVKKFLTPLSFFKLFFTEDLLQTLCGFTNTYAELMKEQKPSLYHRWKSLEPEDLYRFIGLLMYMSIVQVSQIEYYWSTKTLFHGLWARAFMSKFKYKQIQTFLKFSDPNRESVDKITEVKLLHDILRCSCLKYWQPNEQINIDKRMVQSKDRYSFRQDKSTKCGMNMWVLTDSATGYTYNFDVYVGKGQWVNSGFGLGHDVVLNLCKNLFRQGYKLFVDTFYTSLQLFRNLFALGISACGTAPTNKKKEVPEQFRNTNKFNKQSERGDIRWIRLGEIGCVQWKVNKVVTFLTTMHRNINRRSRILCSCSTRINGEFRKIKVRQPSVVVDYNKFLGGVEWSDLLIGEHEVLRSTSKSWKTLFYHFIDIARVNSFVLFQEFRKKYPLPELQRPSAYNQLDFTIELVKELGNIKDDAKVPLYKIKKSKKESEHVKCNALVPECTEIRRNCIRCYREEKVERKSRVLCASCKKHFCFHGGRNCLLAEHDD